MMNSLPRITTLRWQGQDWNTLAHLIKIIQVRLVIQYKFLHTTIVVCFKHYFVTSLFLILLNLYLYTTFCLYLLSGCVVYTIICYI